MTDFKSELREILSKNYDIAGKAANIWLNHEGIIDDIIALFNQTEIHVALTVGKNTSQVYINGEPVFSLGHDKERSVTGNVKLLADIKGEIHNGEQS
jgi:hypothetical protein